MERKNKVPGRIATGIQNMRQFEQSLYLEIITLELERVKSPDVFANHPALPNPKPCGKKLLPLAAAIWDRLEDLCTSSHARVQSGTCSKGDIVYFTSSRGHSFDAGEIITFFSNQSQEVAVINVFTMGNMFETYAEWYDEDTIQAVDLKHLFTAVIHSKSSQKLTTLTPWHLR